MSITEGSGVPANLTWTSVWGPSTAKQTTASFTPDANGLVVVLISGTCNKLGTNSVTISDSLSGTWKQLAVEATNDNVIGGISAVWCRDAGASPSAMTISAYTTNSNASYSGNTGGFLVVKSLLGAQASASQPGGTGIQFGDSATIQASVAAGTGNKVYGSGFNWAANTALTALANTTISDTFADSSDGAWWGAVKSSANTAGTATYGFSTSTQGYLAMAEILASTGGTVSPVRLQPRLYVPIHRASNF